ncbi:GntR family transcriptional regulator [Rhodococcus sp. D2-41]|uniref:GntR family transcriptional regulator n=1 Tax=Speluncibacter jeojiensis TaxID=2710754 RepID=A0A9X4M060_9ACTN|nr:GntR family transcriptional regulator [Rhodococcus sp. D2-41]MDG3009058.1 GntR family transcriptional regulator [Rhodococcus sp. D2-41]MDG3015570.1 GntR family transcriptional regulator [Corynebacteriales bacterium D3-21]
MAAPARSGAALRRRPQLSDQVAGHVRAWIMSGQVRPGEFIRLDETAAELGVSVTPVREALLTLRGEGLVELVPHRGYVVSPLSREDVTDIFWLQGRLAVELAQRAARKIRPEVVDELEHVNDALRRAVAAGETDAVADLEFEFHRLLNLTAGAHKLAWFLHNAIRYTPHRLYAADAEWGALAVDSHERLLEALRGGDLDQVAEHTRIQFTDGAQRLLAHLEQAGIWDEAAEGPVAAQSPGGD